jgi:site-specific recombinase XerD
LVQSEQHDRAQCQVSAFLDHLEHDRGNTPSTRNVRLAAIRSLFRYAALRHPEHAEVIARVLAMPAKRFDRALISFLTTEEVKARARPPPLHRGHHAAGLGPVHPPGRAVPSAQRGGVG